MLPVTAFLLLHVAAGQSPLLRFDGANAGDRLGFAVGAVGDINSDGHDDFFIGIPGDDSAGSNLGAVRVHSGLDGTVLYTLVGSSSGGGFGTRVSSGLDANADGFDDLVVSEPGADVNGADSGSVYVFSGLDGSQLHVRHGAAAGELFGLGAAAGDVDADGYDDWIAGGDAATATKSVYSGFDGSLLHAFVSPPVGSISSVVGLGDLNGDGHSDVGMRRSNLTRVYSGANWSILYDLIIETRAVFPAGDGNGDGVRDFLISNWAASVNGSASGLARLVSGATGGTLHHWVGEGTSHNLVGLPSMGDANGDGHADVLVGSSRRYMRVHSGLDGSLLVRFVLPSVPGTGPANGGPQNIAFAGDIDGDGFDDVIVSWRDWEFPGSLLDLAGHAAVYSGVDLIGSAFCGPAIPNSTGDAARVIAVGSGAVSQNDVTLWARALPTSSFGFFLTSQSQGMVAQPGGSQGVLCLGGSIGRYVGLGQILNSGSAGSFSLAIDLTLHPTPTGPVSIAPGETWNFQAWYRDAIGGTATSNFTDAVEVVFQ